MKIHYLLLSLLMGWLFFTACQKELSLEVNSNSSSGSLQSDVTGECLPKTIQGVYEAGTVLNPATNYIDVQVNTTAIGSYRIYSDTVNGIFFQASGTFATAGLNTVRLPGSGTPLSAGIQNFTISYDSTECIVSISTVDPGGTIEGEFTLAGAGDTCMNYVLAGDYVAGIDMTAANTVVINVDVTILGTYNLTTTVSNGIFFSGAGSFTNLGQHTITLTAGGTPAVAGSTNIPVTNDGFTCSFSVDITTTAPVDYFPLTAASNWSYQFDGNPDDSLFIRAKSGTVIISGNAYTVFEGTNDASAGFGDFGNYRKSGNDYHTYVDLGAFFGLDSAANADYIFLKDNVDVSGSWQSAPVNGTVTDTSGTIFPVSVRIVFTIEQKDVTVTIGSINYDNTIVVVEKYEVFNGATWVDATALIGYFKSYYGRGIGLIKQDYYFEDGNPDPPVDYSQDIRRYQVL